LRHLSTSSLSRKFLRENPCNIPAAKAQHAELRSAYVHFGVRVHSPAPEPELPMQVYTRDSSVMTPYGAIITAMANWWRRGENYAAIRNYERLGIPIYDMVTAGTFEGGDFNVIEENCVLIGCGGGRTQEEGARQVESWFKREGWETRLAFFDEYYVHIDLMVVPIAPKLTAVCLNCTDHRRAVCGYDQPRVQFHVAGKGPDPRPPVEPHPDRAITGARISGGGRRHERDFQDRRRHSLHGAGAAPRLFRLRALGTAFFLNEKRPLRRSGLIRLSSTHQ
jgi:hypothetical protein